MGKPTICKLSAAKVSKYEHQENRRPSSLGRGDKTVMRFGISERGRSCCGGYSWRKVMQKGRSTSSSKHIFPRPHLWISPSRSSSITRNVCEGSAS